MGSVVFSLHAILTLHIIWAKIPNVYVCICMYLYVYIYIYIYIHSHIYNLTILKAHLFVVLTVDLMFTYDT